MASKVVHNRLFDVIGASLGGMFIGTGIATGEFWFSILPGLIMLTVLYAAAWREWK